MILYTLYPIGDLAGWPKAELRKCYKHYVANLHSSVQASLEQLSGTFGIDLVNCTSEERVAALEKLFYEQAKWRAPSKEEVDAMLERFRLSGIPHGLEHIAEGPVICDETKHLAYTIGDILMVEILARSPDLRLEHCLGSPRNVLFGLPVLRGSTHMAYNMSFDLIGCVWRAIGKGKGPRFEQVIKVASHYMRTLEPMPNGENLNH
ncbi:MAG: hypothetical protein JNJ45_11860 [Chthonomonas sp.]|nr:hypothetical protein [Chthonomonas sp.]